MSASEAKKTKQVKRRTWMMPQEVEVWYVLAIRDGVPNFELVGIIQWMPEESDEKENHFQT